MWSIFRKESSAETFLWCTSATRSWSHKRPKKLRKKSIDFFDVNSLIQLQLKTQEAFRYFFPFQNFYSATSDFIYRPSSRKKSWEFIVTNFLNGDLKRIFPLACKSWALRSPGSLSIDRVSGSQLHSWVSAWTLRCCFENRATSGKSSVNVSEWNWAEPVF